MRSALFMLAFCSGQAIAQANLSNQALLAILSEQNAANALNVQQTIAMLPRAENSGCVPMVMMSEPLVVYIDPREGHALAWQPETFDRPPAFEARSWTVPDKLSSVRHRTEKMQAKPWSDADITTKHIAESSHASASGTVRQWKTSNLAMTERSTQGEVSVNGKTYRQFSADAYTSNEQPREPLTSGVRVIFCR
ncbi:MULTISPECIES: hypothetical protein [Burkholderia]|uniref:hypothetical protein n=1 Tax=Burkholderia TaxID=32008 RepID=UPI0007C7AB2E|nr:MULTISPECIES: hypothetical protein [Burkholderia]